MHYNKGYTMEDGFNVFEYLPHALIATILKINI